jgi:hypothetical protein
VGRRHLIRIATAVAIALTLAAPAGAAVRWRLLADGPSAGSPSSSTVAVVALNRAATAKFSGRLTDAARAKLGKVQFSSDAVVAIFGEFGCRDPSIVVSSIEQHGSTLALNLIERPPAPGTMQCMAIYETYRVLLVAKSQLHLPYPTRAAVTLARA